MDDPSRQQGSATQPPGGFFVRLQIFDGILRWLSNLIQLTEEEQEDAGVYLGGPRNK